jgi:hypothetical protein
MIMEDKEVWKNVCGYDNYEISSFGNVRNKKTGRILRPSCNGGYMIVGLSNIKTKTYPVHQLVCKAFIENFENKKQVNHINKNKKDNNVKNLEWSTPLENNIHRSKNVIQTSNQNLKICKINIPTGEIIQKYNSIKEAGENLLQEGVSQNLHSICSSISCCVRGLYKSSFGFKWKLEEQQHLENEEWREINIEGKDTKGYYISSLGRFKNRKGVIMEDYKPHHSGYIYVRVNYDKYSIHQLVALCFIENPENKPIVNHIDGNKTNNNVVNLEWATCPENNLHARKKGLNKGHTREIIQYDLNMNEIQKFSRIIDASTELSISYSCIKDVLKGKQKSTKGFIFKYSNI